MKPHPPRREHIEVGWWYARRPGDTDPIRLVAWNEVTGACRMDRHGYQWWSTEGYLRQCHAIPPDGHGSPTMPPPWWMR